MRLLLVIPLLLPISQAHKYLSTKSNVRPWVDVDTPSDRQTVRSSRGQIWELVMSDEFNQPNRSFAPGDDHLWTALDLPDGVNAALEYYSPNMTTTLKDKADTDDDDNGVFQIEIRNDENITFNVFNAYTRPPGFEDHSMYYRSGMVQSWNKFCFQGGRMEVRAQLPGAVSKASQNPDLDNGDEYKRVEELSYYPTWPGIWLLGNLGRALFTGSTNRMWPWSYNECDDTHAPNQRINACNSKPGFGLNKNQGRGAPEIDILEGGGTDVSTSIQIAPGMHEDFRMFKPDDDKDNPYCFYSGNCDTKGANYLNAPTSTYESRGHKSWYQGLRYAPNGACTSRSSLKQDYAAVKKSVESGIKSNTCEGLNTCPASYDGYSDLGLVDGKGSNHWGVNFNGGCMPKINSYMGSFLCDPDNTDQRCAEPRKEGNQKTDIMEPFKYQMDAISANSGLPVKAYTGYLNYQLEWVTGKDGWVRWEVDGRVVFEITSASIEKVPQDDKNRNPSKVFPEEPLYVIFNVALSTSWGSKPPNPGKPCHGDRGDAKTNRICDEFPMYMKVDFIRLYQDVTEGSSMSVGCDPSTHPTKEWILGHLDEYENIDNPIVDVVGGASCKSHDDCSVGSVGAATIVTGRCDEDTHRCRCLTPNSWGGPRCTLAYSNEIEEGKVSGYGPGLELALPFAVLALGVMGLVAYKIVKRRREQRQIAKEAEAVLARQMEIENSARKLALGGDEVSGYVEPSPRFPTLEPPIATGSREDRAVNDRFL